MKVITTTESVRKADSSFDATLNPVELRIRSSSAFKEIVGLGHSLS
jgi:hypothetical protein